MVSQNGRVTLSEICPKALTVGQKQRSTASAQASRGAPAEGGGFMLALGFEQRSMVLAAFANIRCLGVFWGWCGVVLGGVVVFNTRVSKLFMPFGRLG